MASIGPYNPAWPAPRQGVRSAGHGGSSGLLDGVKFLYQRRRLASVKPSIPLAAVIGGRAYRQQAHGAQMLHRLGTHWTWPARGSADVAGSAAIRVVMQEQQDVDLQLVQPMADRGGFKLGCIELL